jgi:Xaa-Pro aminopeptidase
MLQPRFAEFLKRLGYDSVAIIPGAREATRSNDTHYRFRQDSDFFYLTGFDEPDSVAVLSNIGGDRRYTLFVRPRDAEREIWDGRRAGVEGAVHMFGADAAYPIDQLKERLANTLCGAETLYYRLSNGHAELDELILKLVNDMRSMSRRGVVAPDSIIDPATIIHEMRLVKSEAEIRVMQRAADIAAEAHCEAMKSVRPGMEEYELEALIEYFFRKNGATAPAYTSIVGGGPNATILHYVNNDATLRDGDLVLVDAGAEYRGYASDITRTFPVNGRFTEAQRDIYELVLKAQVSCVEMAGPGVTTEELKNHSIEVLTEGMASLGLLQGEPKKLIEEEKYKQFYMHGLGHYLGMDVHDVGRYHHNGESRKLEPGMVITVEPGIYIAANTKDIPEKYLGIGVRIEDDVVVTETGRRVLSSKVPKQIDEIEALINSGR